MPKRINPEMRSAMSSLRQAKAKAQSETAKEKGGQVPKGSDAAKLQKFVDKLERGK